MNMRIVIEIDGERMTAAGVHLDQVEAPPPDLWRAAKSLGATSAGPAQIKPGVGRRLESPPAPEPEALAAMPTDAGAAPAGPSEAVAGVEEPTKPARRSGTRSPSTQGRSTKR
jgi:hypothetical protein